MLPKNAIWSFRGKFKTKNIHFPIRHTLFLDHSVFRLNFGSSNSMAKVKITILTLNTKVFFSSFLYHYLNKTKNKTFDRILRKNYNS